MHPTPYNSVVIKPPGPSVSKVGALAPSGLVERLRGDAGRLLVTVPTNPVQAPGFVVGEAVTARLIEPLPNRQWVAVIKSALFTLQLPQWATDVATEPAADSAGKLGMLPTQGETMSLQVASLTPRLTFALIHVAAAAPATGAAAVQLSDAARTLSELLRAGERGPLPTGFTSQAALTVLLGDPAATPSERAQGLAQAVSHSGLFYESHLLAWAEGRLPLSSLLTEPQARLAEGLKLGLNDASPTATSLATQEAASIELGGLLQRQLDALDGKPLAFTGFAWPGQPAQWRIQRDVGRPPDREAAADRDDRNNESVEHPPAWTTQIQLTLPRLGARGAQLRVTGSQVTLAMTLDNDASAALLATHRARLASALQVAGLNLAALTVQQPATQDEHTEKP